MTRGSSWNKKKHSLLESWGKMEFILQNFLSKKDTKFTASVGEALFRTPLALNDLKWRIETSA